MRLVEHAFLTITDRVLCCGERGLLSVAFRQAMRPKPFYVNYTASRMARPSCRAFTSRQSDVADAASEQIVLT